MESNRRKFLTSATALACAAFCGAATLADGLPAPSSAPAVSSELSGKSLLAKTK
jgi:hypothetical protein